MPLASPPPYWTLPGHCPHLSSGSPGADWAGSKLGNTVAECLGSVCTQVWCPHLKIKPEAFGDFLWVCVIDDGNFPYWLGWLRINYNENREHERACLWLPLQINMQNNAGQRFQWLGYALSENLITELNHKRLLIEFYLTHKKKCSVLPVAWIKHLPSVVWAVTCPAIQSPTPFAHSKKKAHIEPAGTNYVVTSHMNQPTEDRGTLCKGTGQLGSTLPLKLCQVDENWMKCLTATARMHTQEAEQRRDDILSGAESCSQSMRCPRGNSSLSFSTRPSGSVGNTSQPPKGSPSLPTWLWDVQTSARVFPSVLQVARPPRMDF